jgi:hypothetical protein
MLTIRNDFYDCEIARPPKRCKSTVDCPAGQLCGGGWLNQVCVKCSSSITDTYYDKANITTNVTAAMLAGKFWQVNKFSNHDGVILNLLQYVCCTDHYRGSLTKGQMARYPENQLGVPSLKQADPGRVLHQLYLVFCF